MAAMIDWLKLRRDGALMVAERSVNPLNRDRWLDVCGSYEAIIRHLEGSER